jgi:hypothetical protein
MQNHVHYQGKIASREEGIVRFGSDGCVGQPIDVPCESFTLNVLQNLSKDILEASGVILIASAINTRLLETS